MHKSIFAVKNGGLMSHRHNFVTISGRKFTENAEKPGRRAPERVPLPGFLSIKWHVVFKMKAHRRPVSGCGSQRMLHALERRSHPADHGPSFASLYSPFCRYATSSPDRGKSFKVRGFGSPRKANGFAKGSPFGGADTRSVAERASRLSVKTPKFPGAIAFCALQC